MGSVSSGNVYHLNICGNALPIPDLCADMSPPVTAAQAAGGVLVVAGLWVVTLLAAPSKAASFRAGAVERHMGSAWSTGPDDNLSDSEDDSWLT